jgi:AraC family transcriptional activator of pobA
MKLRNLRPLYAHSLDIRMGKLRVMRFALNRHLPEKGWVETHRHAHGQFLLYLTGTGTQWVGGRKEAVQAGRVFYLAPGCEHAFVEDAGGKPLCLALDVSVPGETASAQAMLAQGELNELRRALTELRGWSEGEAAQVRPGEAGAVLMVLDVLMRAVGLLEERKGAEGTVVRRARAVFSGVDGGGEGLPVAKLAERVGYHPDHLTRLLKKETGMTAGQLRAALRLKRAQAELEAGATVAEAAERSGFADANYFTRWFKRQTAKTPREWRAGRE